MTSVNYVKQSTWLISPCDAFKEINFVKLLQCVYDFPLNECCTDLRAPIYLRASAPRIPNAS